MEQTVESIRGETPDKLRSSMILQDVVVIVQKGGMRSIVEQMMSFEACPSEDVMMKHSQWDSG